MAPLTGVIVALRGIIAALPGGADFHELEVSTVSSSGPWTAAGSFTNSRGLHAEGFAHGQDVHARAVGVAGEGPWSDPAVVLVS